MSTTTIRHMKRGDKGKITRINIKGEMNRRLRDMGLVPGTEIEIQSRAPLYDPVNIKLRGNNLSLRNNEADYIEVETGAEKPAKINVVLAGNPNAGKSSLFNRLTGSRAHVGNFPGITVSKKEKTLTKGNQEIRVVDLPGTYSLTAYSPEELVARNYILDEAPDMVVLVVDAANLDRNLYLAVQLMEIGAPIVIALNMIDVAMSRGIKIDHEKLGELLGIKMVPTVARSNKGIDDLLDTVLEEINRPDRDDEYQKISYGSELDVEISEIVNILTEHEFQTDKYPYRWLAIKALEGDSQVLDFLNSDESVGNKITKRIEKVTDHIHTTLNDEPEGIIADYRYGFISSITKQTVKNVAENRRTISDLTDRFLLHRIFGPVALILILYFVYQFVFWISEAPVSWMALFFGWLGQTVETLMPPGLLESLIVSGIIDGVGGVLSFVPLIFVMFLAIAALEDTGYMARIAFIMDRVLRTFGLHGNSIMALIISGGISGGCAVPGILATRTLRDPKERLATILVAPLMNCGAKLPVYAMLIAAFFANNQAQIMFLLTLLAWSLALVAARILRWTILKGKHTPFVMELPPYRLPTVKGLLIHTWERTWQYIRKAGTIILGVSILIWAIMTFPGLPENKVHFFDGQVEIATANFLAKSNDIGILSSSNLEKFKTFLADFEKGKKDSVEIEDGFADVAEAVTSLKNGLSLKPKLQKFSSLAIEYTAREKRLGEIALNRSREKLKSSIAGRIGSFLEVITKPLGFDWRVNISLVGGFAAKEVVLSTLGTAYSLSEIGPDDNAPLSEKLANSPDWNPLIGFTMLIFVMVYAPCLATLITISRETRSIKWSLVALTYTTSLAYVLALLVATIGRALGIGV